MYMHDHRLGCRFEFGKAHPPAGAKSLFITTNYYPMISQCYKVRMIRLRAAQMQKRPDSDALASSWSAPVFCQR